MKRNPLSQSHLKPVPEQQQWLALAIEKNRIENPNPCVRMFGKDKMDRKCKDCRLLLRKILRSSKVFFKCRLRGNTGGPGTDHRAGWDACIKFVPRQQHERKTAGNKIMFCA